ncbi:MAG: hypothetical protein ACRDJV_02015 [Actinomycetota bacterium]
MAIKGKKKSQTRGSQARRRPASAPRPVVTGRAREPWYRSSTGRMAAVVVLVLIVSLTAGVLVNATSDEELEARQAALERFTDEVRTLRGQVTDVAAQMARAALSPRQDGFEDLGKDARRWGQTLGATVGPASTLEPPAGLSASAQLLSQAVRTYTTAAETFRLAATVDAKAQPELLVLAASQREQALEMWNHAVRAVEAERADADLDPSGLQPPAQPGGAPPIGTTPPAGVGDGGQGENKKGAKKDGKGN